MALKITSYIILLFWMRLRAQDHDAVLNSSQTFFKLRNYEHFFFNLRKKIPALSCKSVTNPGIDIKFVSNNFRAVKGFEVRQLKSV